MTSVTIQHFHEDIEAAERLSAAGPVIITEDGLDRRVLLDIEDYHRIMRTQALGAVFTDASHSADQDAGSTSNSFAAGTSVPDDQNLALLLAVPDEKYFDWEPQRITGKPRPFEFD